MRSSDAASTSDATPRTRAAAPSVVEGEYIVVFRQQALATASASSIATSLRNQYGASLRYTYQHALQGAALGLTDEQLEQLESDDRVDYIVPNTVVTATETQTDATWGIDRIDQVNLPLDETYTYLSSGDGVHVYIIDTGIYADHNEFSTRVMPGTDTIDNDDDPDDCNGHGTHVAGTAVGTVYGVAKDAWVHGVRVLDCGGFGSAASVIAGVDWVTANHEGPAVANMSLGGGFNQAINDAVANSIAAGVTYAIAAGNDNFSACNNSPSSTPEALTVASSNINDQRSFFSNFGECVDLFAPGEDITSAWIGAPDATDTISGTSMASPHTAGVVALVLEGNPNATPAEIAEAITAAATPDLITDPQAGTPNLLLHMSELGNPSRGRISVVEAVSCGDEGIEITLRDADLLGSGTATISAQTAAGDTETVILTEVPGSDDGSFTGSVPLAEGPAMPGDGVIQVEHAAAITLTYEDADSGDGTPQTVEEVVGVDCEGPSLSNIQTSFVTGSSAGVTADASEPVTMTVNYGTSCADLSGSASSTNLSESPAVTLTGLTSNTTYSYAVSASDAQGNTTADDNGGLCYTFTTPDTIFDEDFDDGIGSFTPTGLWHQTTACADAQPGHSVPGSLYYGDDASCTYETGGTNSGVAQSAPFTVDLSASPTLSFNYLLETEGGTFYDQAYVAVSIDGGTPVIMASSFAEGEALMGNGSWNSALLDLSGLGTGVVSMEIEVGFDTVDSIGNTFAGFYVDDFEVSVDVTTPCSSDEECDDGVACTSESCNLETGLCEVTPDDSVCDDGVFCNGAEVCTATGCDEGLLPTCDDGVSCTVDFCDPEADACSSFAEDELCDNGLFCDGTETCNPMAGCEPGEPVVCDDGIDCTVDACDEGIAGCAATPDDTVCDNGLFCDGAEVCSVADAGCIAGDPPCEADECDEELALCEGPSSDLFTNIVVHTDWGAGYCTMLEITNSAPQATLGWTIVLDMHDTVIDHLWNADRTGNTGAITLTPLSWNAQIPTGTTNTSIGFCALRPNGGSETADVVSSVGIYP